MTLDGNPGQVRADTRKSREPAYVAGSEPPWNGPRPFWPACILCGTRPDHLHALPLWQLAALLDVRAALR